MITLGYRATPLLIGTLLAVGAVVTGFIVGGSHLEGAQLAARWTSRVGLPVFLTAYLASTLLRFSKNDLTKALMRRRRQWGLAFALTHSVHLAALFYYLMIAGMPPELLTLLGGGLAYVLIYLMAFTSNDSSVRLLGKNWKRLHVFGIHYIWFIYTFTYLGRLIGPDFSPAGIVGFGALLLALILRLWGRFGIRRQISSQVGRQF